MRFLDGSEQRFRDFGTPVRFWTIGLGLLTEEEMRQVQDFFEAKQGRYGSFSFRGSVGRNRVSGLQFRR